MARLPLEMMRSAEDLDDDDLVPDESLLASTCVANTEDLLREILDHIAADPDRCINIDRRAYLSVESFRPPSPPAPSQLETLANFRLTCRRFARLAIPHQFGRITTRFSKRGFKRLDLIAGTPHIAEQVKKFSYMVPNFYDKERNRVGELLDPHADAWYNLDPEHFTEKVQEQIELVSSQEDLHVLTKAVSAFSSLQHIQILRLVDQQDRQLLDFLHRYPDVSLPLVQLGWGSACLHASRTIAQAVHTAETSPCSRFSGPMTSPEAAIYLQDYDPIGPYIPDLASRLTCLELHFDDHVDLDSKMLAICPFFGRVFAAATRLQAVHIGFPSRCPLSLPLEAIFHNIQWDSLRAFGIQAWRLSATEIIHLARRHRRTLRGLRLRDVLLRDDGSLWRDVLSVLRDEMERLDWISLRRIGYSAHFDSIWAGVIEVPDEIPGGASDSDDESFTYLPHPSSDDDEDDDVDALSDAGSAMQHTHHHHHHHQDSDMDDSSLGQPDMDDDDDDDYDEESDSAESNGDDDDHGPEANDIALSPDTPTTLPWCNCGRDRSFSVEDLGDNGREVSYQQRKMWEGWVIRSCPEHR